MSSLDVRAIDETDLPHVPVPATRQEYRVFLAEAAFDRAVERGASDTTREIGGVLVGQLLRDDAGPYLLVETTIDALYAEEKGAELTFTHATWDHIHKEMDTRHPGKRVVGWYHTHPGFGVFLSDRDQFIHKSFFDLPFQVALVYDPKAKEHALFTWRDDEVIRARRYWIGSREQLWDGARSHADPPDKGKDRARSAEGPAPVDPDPGGHAGRSGPPSFPATPPYLAIATALLLVLGAGLLGHWLASIRARDALAEAEREILRARADGAQLAIGSLQSDLVGILRETLADQAVRKPTALAIGELDQAVDSLQGADRSPYLAGTTDLAGLAGLAGDSDPIRQALTRVTRARESLVRLRDDRALAETVLAKLELSARRGDEPRDGLAGEVAEQRSALGGLYAELAVDAVKARDTARARRLLAAAAHIDPGNRARYQKQLESFDSKGTLPREIEPRGRGGRR